MMQLWDLGPQRQTDLVRLLDSDAATMTRTIRVWSTQASYGGALREPTNEPRSSNPPRQPGTAGQRRGHLGRARGRRDRGHVPRRAGGLPRPAGEDRVDPVPTRHTGCRDTLNTTQQHETHPVGMNLNQSVLDRIHRLLWIEPGSWSRSHRGSTPRRGRLDSWPVTSSSRPPTAPAPSILGVGPGARASGHHRWPHRQPHLDPGSEVHFDGDDHPIACRRQRPAGSRRSSPLPGTARMVGRDRQLRLRGRVDRDASDVGSRRPRRRRGKDRESYSHCHESKRRLVVDDPLDDVGRATNGGVEHL